MFRHSFTISVPFFQFLQEFSVLRIFVAVKRDVLLQYLKKSFVLHLSHNLTDLIFKKYAVTLNIKYLLVLGLSSINQNKYF